MFFKLLCTAIILTGQLLSFPIFCIKDMLGVPREAEHNNSQEFKPFSVQSQYLKIQPADFKKLNHQSLSYQQYDGTFTATIPITMMSGLISSLGYVGTSINWDTASNPIAPELDTNGTWLGYHAFQDQNHYHYMTATLGAYTLGMQHWKWSVIFSTLMDPQNFKIGYMLFQSVISGKYAISDQLELVMGVINETGLHQEKAWPLLGGTFKPNDKLTIHCIYPINFSVEYQCSSVCFLGGSYKLTRFRKKFRKSDLISSEGIFEYQGRAIEGNVKLLPNSNSSLKAFYGLSLGSDISIADAHNHNINIHPFKSSAFWGGSLVLNF